MGNFSVRSGYFVARDVLGRNNNSILERLPLWNSIWKSRVYPKVHFFMWRLVKGILPIRSNLQQRGMILDDEYVTCGVERENVEHLFFLCHFSRTLWDMQCPWILTYQRTWANMDDMWQRLIQKASQFGSIERVFFTCWLIWYNRNICLHEASCGIAQAISRSINYHMQQLSQTSIVNAIDRLPIRWKAPPIGVIKLNMDVTYENSMKMAGLAVVMWGSSGEILGCKTSFQQFVLSSLYAEVLAIRMGVQWASAEGIRSCIIESDCLVAISAIQSQDRCEYPEGVAQIKENGFAIRRFFDRLKAETPVIRTARASPDGAKAKTVFGDSKREGKMPVLGASMTTGAALKLKGCGSSMLALACAIAAEERSCEIVSKIRSKNVEQLSGEQEVNSSRFRDLNRNFVCHAEKQGAEMGALRNSEDFAARFMAIQQQLLPEGMAETPLLEGDCGSSSKDQGLAFNGLRTIPSIGPSKVCLGTSSQAAGGPNQRMEQTLGQSACPIPTLAQQENDSGLQHLKKKARAVLKQEESHSSPLPTEVRQLLAELAKTSPFVFGAATTSTLKQPRRWKKVARVTDKYFFQCLGPQMNLVNGRKRGSTQESRMSVEDGVAKRA
ncbi:hypothetical protein COLO4_07398 [Corchorus olitorius]|uniref:Reverse transcriptase zinc-binding domain-containing protein n=1 Tax=Corchorus olitorius TaxID=93759 RepID=A0A1R3KJW3_9ROSI|nr:hypothetical protein COLO4_07398 [Corchorus olitorius]